jgi:hypothetical protein
MKKSYLLIGALMFAGGLSAQFNGNYAHSFSSIQKHAPNGVTFTDMRDQLPAHDDRATYYTENFDAGFGGWTPAISIGVVGFQITSTGHANDAGSTFFIPALLTSTPTNWVLLDSDSDGSAAAGEEMATLTSPVIDLVAGGLAAGAPPYPLKVEMEQFYAGWQADTIFLEVSDDGVVWDQIEIMNNSVGREGRPNPELVSINITPYVTDPTQVRLRFRWHGNWDYGWQFDNVKILDLPMHDMTCSKVFRADWINNRMYSLVPEEQAVEFVIGADVKNIGYEDLTGAGIDWEILDASMAVVASGSSTPLTLSNNENDTVWVNTGFTPTALGVYTVNVTATSDSTEAALDLGNNDKSDAYYELTDYIYSADYGPSYTAFYNWSTEPSDPACIGTIFNIVTDDIMGGVIIGLDDDAAVVDQIIYGAMMLWDGSAWNTLTQTDEYTTTAADQGELITLYFDSQEALTGGSEALVLACHYSGPGFQMTGQVPGNQTAGTLADGTVTGLLDPSAPVVRALMHDFTGVEENNAANKFSIYPNPANDNLTLNLMLSKSENTVITIMDLSGKALKTVEVGNVNGSKNMNINVDDLATGAYFIEVAGANGKMVQKFIKK